MNEGGENDHALSWEYDYVCSLMDFNNHQNGSEETFEGNKLSNLTRSDIRQPLTTVNEVVEASTMIDKQKSPPNQKKNRKRSVEPKSGAAGGGDRGESKNEIHIWTERERRKKMRFLFKTLHALLPNFRTKADNSTIVEEAVKHIQTMQHTFINLIQQKLERLMVSQELPNVDISWELNLIQQKLERLMGLQKFPNVGISWGLNLIQQKLERLMGSKKLPNVGISWEQFLGDQGSTSNSAAITPTSHGDSPLLMNMNNIPTVFQTWNSPNVILNVCGEDAHISVCCPKKPGLLSFICYVLEKHKIEMVSAQTSSDQFRSMFMIQAHAKGGSGSAQFSEASTVVEMFRQAATEIMAMATPK